MSFTHNNNKRAVETFLVASATETALPTDATALNNTSTGAVNLNDGQIGIFGAYPVDQATGFVAMNTAVNHTTTYDTVATAPWIQLFQGTAESANPGQATATYPLWVRPYEKSQVIKGGNNLMVTKKEPVAPTLSTWAIGQPAGTGSGEITAEDNTLYQMNISFRGRIMDEHFSPEATASFYPEYTTPNYTDMGTAQPVDHLLQNLAWEINRNSAAVAVNRTKFRGNAPVVALLIDAAGTYDSDGTEIGEGGTGGTAIAAGDFLPIVSTQFGVRGITLTAVQAQSIIDAAIALTGAANVAALDANVLTIDLTTAGTTTGGAGDSLILLALDRELAFEDRIAPTKIRLDVGLTRGFDFSSVTHREEVNASEGVGQGRALDLWYKATHGQRKYNLEHTLDPEPVFPSPIDTTDAYYQYTIIHEDPEQVDTGNVVVSPMREILLIPDANTTLVTAIDNVLGAWVASANGVGIVEA
jgi:hypothetical protein